MNYISFCVEYDFTGCASREIRSIRTFFLDVIPCFIFLNNVEDFTISACKACLGLLECSSGKRVAGLKL